MNKFTISTRKHTEMQIPMFDTKVSVGFPSSANEFLGDILVLNNYMIKNRTAIEHKKNRKNSPNVLFFNIRRSLENCFNIKSKKLMMILLLIIAPMSYAQLNPFYYSSVDTSTPELMRITLHDVIDDHFRFPYTALITDTWDILEIANQDPSNPNNVIDVYKNSSYPKVGGNNLDYNREHTWPKSYGFPNNLNSNFPYTDMHHLFLAHDSYNSSRNNKPYDYCIDQYLCVEKVTELNNGRGGVNQSNFTSPDIWEVWTNRRGDIARALLYMDIRYEGGVNIFGYPEPDLILTDNLTNIYGSATGENESVAYMGLLSVLIAWHYEDPIDDFERQHNETVATYQTNRNPFVDHPEWVACLFELVCDRIFIHSFEL